ncbi:ATP-binding protein [Kitasatospora sp. NPDC096147]|uniref:ATP-binding protein n=1 Tax=Kitasatospora sp. NPDC096147 TaxID=3364093 RepID=UPI003809504B
MTVPAVHQPHPYLGGRERALRELAHWHSDRPSAPKVLLVTGGPGSGRSRLVDGFLMLCDPEHRQGMDVASLDPATVPAADRPAPLVFDARGLTAAQLLWSVADTFGMEATRTEEVHRLLAEPAGQGTPPVPVVVPDVDRAGVLRLRDEPALVAEQVLLPLALAPAVRLLADVPRQQARWLADRLPAGSALVVDLDEEPWADPAALLLQAEHTLGRPEEAPEVARHAAGPLVVRLAAGMLWAVPDGSPAAHPDSIGQALDLHAERCGTDELTLRRLLAPLALLADGATLPIALWAPLASAVAGKDLTKAFADGQRLLLPFFELVEEEDGPAVRPVHPAVAAEVRERLGSTTREVQRRITAALLATVPDGAGPARWAEAPPYVRLRLAGHALEGGALPELLADPGFVLHAGQALLRSAVEHLAATGTELPPLGLTWLRLAPLLTRTEAGPLQRAALMEHACRQDGLPAVDFGLALPWETLWAVPLPGVDALTAAFTPDGTAVVVAHVPGDDPVTLVHDQRTGAPVDVDPELLVLPGEQQRADCPVRLSVGGDYVRIWRRDEGGPLAVFLSPGPLGGVDVSPDGVLLVADGRGVSALRLTAPELG